MIIDYSNVMELRENELLFLLQIEMIHLLLERHEDIKFLEHSIVESEKMYYYHLNRRMLYGDAFRYVSEFLLNKTTIIMNADCYLADGFQKLDKNILRKDTIYALTRHETPKAIKHCGAKDFCAAQAKYIGSHDAFVLNLAEPLHRSVLDSLMVRQDIVGVEKFVIFILRVLGKFTVKNPCHFLFIFHNHCTKFRQKQRRLIHGKRFNVLYLANVPRWKTNAPFSGL